MTDDSDSSKFGLIIQNIPNQNTRQIQGRKKAKTMNYLLFLIVFITFSGIMLTVMDYNLGIILPILIVSTIIVAVVRVVLIRRKNNY